MPLLLLAERWSCCLLNLLAMLFFLFVCKFDSVDEYCLLFRVIIGVVSFF